MVLMQEPMFDGLLIIPVGFHSMGSRSGIVAW